LSEVDEDVPAGHEIELRERWVPGEIVPDEDAELSDVLVDAMARLDLGEEAPAPFLADVPHDRVGVGALAGGLDGALADVRAEDLDGMASGRVVQELEQNGGERIELPGGAPGDPEADGLPGSLPSGSAERRRTSDSRNGRIRKNGDMDQDLLGHGDWHSLGLVAKRKREE
jgi:hypothetical protein